MTQARLDLQSQLVSQNISNISDPTTTPLCNTSPILFLSPIEPTNIEPTNNPIEQMDNNNTVSESLDKPLILKASPKTVAKTPKPPEMCFVQEWYTVFQIELLLL